MNQDANRARWIAVIAATAIALYVCWLMLAPFIAVLEWAAVLVIVFYPVHRRLASRIKRPGLSALLSSLLVVLVVLIPLGLLIAALTGELRGAAQSLPQQLAPLFETESPSVARVLAWLHQNMNLGTAELQQLIGERFRDAGAALLNQSLGILGNLLLGIVKVFFVIFTMYYLFRDGESIVEALPEVLPLKRSQSEAILERTVQVISASVYGVVTIAMIQGALAGFAFWILGVPSPILWAVALTFVCMIPVAGSFFVWLPAAIYLGMNGHWTKAVLLILWGALVISTIDNFLRPRLISHYTRLHELLVFFSVLGGMKVFGLLGIVLGPVVLAITIGLLNTFKQAPQSPHSAD